MHLQNLTIRRGERTYTYFRLVQSYRREDGTPAHKVIANLGQLPPLMVQNLKTALQATREGKTVVVGELENKNKNKSITPAPSEEGER